MTKHSRRFKEQFFNRQTQFLTCFSENGSKIILNYLHTFLIDNGSQAVGKIPLVSWPLSFLAF